MAQGHIAPALERPRACTVAEAPPLCYGHRVTRFRRDPPPPPPTRAEELAQLARRRASDNFLDVIADFIDDHPTLADMPVALLYFGLLDHSPRAASLVQPFVVHRHLAFTVDNIADSARHSHRDLPAPRLRAALAAAVAAGFPWPAQPGDVGRALERAPSDFRSLWLNALTSDVFGTTGSDRYLTVTDALARGGERARLAQAALTLREQVRWASERPVRWPVLVDDNAPLAAARRRLLAGLADARGGRAAGLTWAPRDVRMGDAGIIVALSSAEGRGLRVDVNVHRATCDTTDAGAAAMAFATAYDLINEPFPDEARLLEHICRPRYERVVAALQAFVDDDSAPERPERIEWEISAAFGGLSLRCRRQKAKPKSRGWSKGVFVTPQSIVVDDAASERDRRVAALLTTPKHDTVRAALLALAGHDCIVDEDGGPVDVVAGTIAVSLADQADGAVRAAFVIDGRVVVDPGDIGAPACIVVDKDAPGADPARTRYLVAPVTARMMALAAILNKDDTIPAEGRAAVERLADRVAALPAAPMQLSPSLTGELVGGNPRLVVRLALTDPLTLSARVSSVAGDGAGFDVPGEGPDFALALKDGKRVRYARHRAKERADALALMAQLSEGVTRSDGSGDDAFAIVADGDAALDLFRQAENCGHEVVWRDQRRFESIKTVEAKQLRVRVTTARTWLGLDGDVDLDGETLTFAALLAAVRHQRRYVQLQGDRFAVVSDDLHAALRGVAALTADAAPVDSVDSVGEGAAAVAVDDAAGKGKGKGKGKKAKASGPTVEVPFAVAPALDVLDAAGVVFDEGAVWRQMRARLDRARVVSDAPPAGLVAELRPYQRDGLLFLRRLAAFGTGGVLADDMGLGKTIQAIALLLDRAQEGPALVVAPTSLIFNWQREIERFAPSLHTHIYGEANDRAAVRSAMKKGDVLIVSYGLVDDAFADASFATAIFDEAQAIKNADTQRARACRDLSADIKIALSGTPLENHLGELWSLFQVVSPGLLGSAEQFRRRFLLPIEKDRSVQHRHQLASTLRPFLLRRTKQEVLPELPALTQQLVDVEAPAAAKAFYNALRAEILSELDDGGNVDDRRFRVLAGLTRLRLCCCHPVLVEPTYSGSSAKLDAAVATLEQVKNAGHKALVFSQFVKFLDLVEPALVAAGLRVLRLDGSTPQAERRKRVDAFQRGEADVFLLSLKAGGAGLNLTAADVVVHLDPWWNPAVEAQAIARAHRMGRAEPVTAIRLVVRDTIEEAILRLHDDKRELVDSVLAGSGGGAGLRLEEIAALLRDSAVGL
jgi:superfamily II DNA or RNA helicase